MTDRRIALAAIIGAHGVAGEVRLKLFAEDIDALRRYTGLLADGRPLTIRSIRPGPNGAVARFAEIADRNAAEALRGAEITVSRAELPPLPDGEYYHCDIVGLPCVDPDGRSLGGVVAVENFGAGDIFEIERADGKRVMVPAHAAVIAPERLTIDPAFLD